MVQSVSKAVREILLNLAYLHYPLEKRLLNDSAVAKFIKPQVEEKTGKQVSLGAVTAAVRRFTLAFKPGEKTRNLILFLKSSQLHLRTGLVDASFKRSYQTSEKLALLAKKIRWEQGEKMYVLQRTDEITVIAHAVHRKEVLACAPKRDLLDTHENRAVITVVFERSLAKQTYGGLRFLSDVFASLGVPIYLAFLTYSACSFVFNESHAPIVYKRLSESLSEIRAANPDV